MYSKNVMCAVHNTTVSEQNVPTNIHAAGLSPCLHFFQMALYTVVSSQLDVLDTGYCWQRDLLEIIENLVIIDHMGLNFSKSDCIIGQN